MNRPDVKKPATVRCPFCLTLNRVDLARIADRPRCGSCKRPILLDRPLAVGDDDFERVINGTAVPVLLDCHAEWCAPCKAMAPLVDELAGARAGDLLVLKLDTDQNPRVATALNIRGIPTFIAFQDGKERRRHVGMADRATLEALVAVS
jgi:thioredoxin 2